MSVATDETTRPAHARSTVRPDKAAAVAELAEAFRTSSAAVLTEYRGLTVKQLRDLRRALGADTTYSVAKNTLTTIAARDAGIEGVDELLVGPTAVAFVSGDPVEAAKALREFARANPALVVKGGVLEGRALSAAEVTRLADLESREVLLAKLAGAMKASLSQAVYLLNAPLAQAARLIAALEAKAQEDPSVLAGGAGTAAPATDAGTTDAGTTDAGTTDAGQTDVSTTDESTADAATADEAPAAEAPADDAAEAPADAAAEATSETDQSETDQSETE